MSRNYAQKNQSSWFSKAKRLLLYRSPYGPSPVLSWLAAWAGIFGLVAGIVGLVLALPGWMAPQARAVPSANEQLIQGSASSSAGSIPSPKGTTASEDYAASIGTCLSRADDGSSEVPCEVPHRAEVIASSGECNTGALTGYLGGNRSIDIVRNDLRLAKLSSGECSASLPPTMSVLTSVRGILDTTHSAAFRQCLNARTGMDVACDQKHTGEVVSVVDLSNAKPLNCDAAADRYMNHSLADFASQLTASNETASKNYRCVVSVKGSNSLTSTLRALGTTSLPIVPY